MIEDRGTHYFLFKQGDHYSLFSYSVNSGYLVISVPISWTLKPHPSTGLVYFESVFRERLHIHTVVFFARHNLRGFRIVMEKSLKNKLFSGSQGSVKLSRLPASVPIKTWTMRPRVCDPKYFRNRRVL